MTWDLDDRALELLRSLWSLAPAGEPVRALTGPLGQALTGAIGPEDANARATEVLHDSPAALEAALVLKRIAGEVDVLLHAIGIAASLPHVLAADERVESVSVDHAGGGTAGSAGISFPDLVTDRQIAEFTFIQWRPKGNGMREVKLLRDLIKLELLDEAMAGSRQRILYVTEDRAARRFFGSRQKIDNKLARHADVLRRFHDRHGTEFATVGEYWRNIEARQAVHLVDLYAIAPELRRISLAQPAIYTGRQQ